jgi:uncharacterized membrane protein YhhN
MGMVGRMVGLVGGVVYIAGMFLHYLDAQGVTRTIWQAADRLDVVVLILVLAAMGCLALSIAVPSRALPALAAAFGAASFAFVTPIDADNLDPFGPGMWVTAIAGLAIVAGSVLTAADPGPHGGRTAAVAAGPGPGTPAAGPPPPPAGAPGPPPPTA